MAIERIKLNLIPTGTMPVCHASQYDNKRQIGIDIYNGLQPYILSDELLELDVRKSDGHIVTIDVPYTAGGNGVVFETTEQMCAVAGSNLCELKITKGEAEIGSLNFYMEIERSPMENGLASDSEIENLRTQMRAIAEPMVEEIAPPIVEKLVPQVIGDDYYTAEQTDDAIATAIEGKADASYVDTELAKKADKTDTYTKSQVDTKLDAKANANSVYTKTEVDDKLSEKANADDVYQKTETYSKTETDNLVSPKADKTYVDTKLQAKANASDVYGKAYIDTALSGKANVGTSYTKSEEDALLANKADKSDTYTKKQVDDIVYNILPDETASGSVANFNTSLELPIKSLEVDVNAVQEAGTPTPASPLPISGWSEISLYQRGANLFDKTTVVDDYYINDTTGAQRYNAGDKCTDFIEIKPEVAYFIYSEQTSGRWGAWYDKNKNYISGIITYGTKTSPANAKYARFTVVRNGNGNVDTFSVNYPSTFTTYEPYNGNTEVINLGGTYYGGHFTQDKDGHRQLVITSESKKINEFDGWQYLGGYNYFECAVENMKGSAATSVLNGLICECYATRTAQQAGSGNIDDSIAGWTYTINNEARLRIKDNDFNNVSNWLNSMGNYLIVYPLETPIIIDLPDGEPIATLIGTNNIYADTGDCAVEYKVSVEDYVSAHSGGNLLGMGGVYLGGAKSGGGEEDTEKTKEIDEPKEEIKTIGEKKIGGE